MESPYPRESDIIDYREIWLSVDPRQKKERKKDRKKEKLAPDVVTHRKNGLLGFDRPKTIKLSISCIVNCCCILLVWNLNQRLDPYL